MSASPTSQFSIYNFFSVLLPGVIFLIGMYPFLPKKTGSLSLGAVVPLLAIGFVVGQFLHIVSVWAENRLEVSSHRDLLSEQLQSPTILSEGTVEDFYTACKSEFGNMGLSGDMSDDAEDDQLMDTLYVRVRSSVDFDAQGRSQIFQAIYAFCRSICFCMAFLGLIYFVYAIRLIESNASAGIPPLPYTPKISILELSSAIVLNITLLIVVLTFIAFWGAKREYRQFFIQYLIIEFLLLQDAN